MTSVALRDEQVMLAATAARMVADHLPIHDHASSRSDAGLWTSLVANDLVGLMVSEEPGGTAEPTLNAALVIEQLARGLAAAPYLGTVLSLDLLVAAAPEGGEVTELLGGRPGCVVVDSTLGAAAPQGIAVDAVPGALAVGVDGRVVCAAVLGAPLDSVDPSRPLAQASGPGIALGPISEEALVRWRALALALVCADLVGTCSGALEAAVTHAGSRHQFGHPIGSFQAVQHLCADQLVSVEAARSIMWHAAWAVDALVPAEALALARIAKAYCSEMARTVCEAAIQVWGGLGMTWECSAHRSLRRALLDRQLFGDERVHLAAIAADRLGPASRDVA